jgi:hypothetical protein
MMSSVEGDSPVERTLGETLVGEDGRQLLRMTYFAEEFLKGIAAQDMSIRLEAGLTKRLLKKLGHFKPHAEKLSGLFFLWNRE